MLFPNPARVGYVLKRYPRYSETFIVNEILAHEAAGLSLEILSLRPPCDTHFQDRIARVRAPVRYFAIDSTKSVNLWAALRRAAELRPMMWKEVSDALDEDALTVHQALFVAAAVREYGLSHLHAHFATESASVARLAARLAGVTYSFTAHAKDIYHNDRSFVELQRKLAEAFSVVTVSDYNVHYLRETFGAAARGVQRIYNGLDLADFSYRVPQNRPPVVAAVGRLVEKKGFSDLIEACRLLANEGVQFQCKIIGTGELEQPLQQLIEQHQLLEHVQLLGPRPQAEVIRTIQEAAVFAAPCVVGSDGNRDGLPTVLLEAMALGTPCISTPVTGIPEIVHHGRTGIIVPEHSPASLCHAILQLLSDSQLRIRLATEARLFVEQHFDIHQNAAQLRTIFRDAMNSNPELAWLPPLATESTGCPADALQEIS